MSLADERAKEDAPSTSAERSKRTDAIAKRIFGSKSSGSNGNGSSGSKGRSSVAKDDTAWKDEPVDYNQMAKDVKRHASFVTGTSEKPVGKKDPTDWAAKAAADKAYEDARPAPKPAAKKSASGGGKKKKAAPSRADIGQEPRPGFAKVREQSKTTSEPGGKIDTEQMAKDTGQKGASLGPSYRVSSQAPAAAKKRGKLGRVVRAVGRGFRKTGRGIKKAFA